MRLGHGFGSFGEQPRHFGGGLEVPLGIGGEAAAGLVQRRMLADAGHDVGERPALGGVHERRRWWRAAGRPVGRARAARARRAAPQAGAVMMRRGEPDGPGPASRRAAASADQSGVATGASCARGAIRQDHLQALGMVEQVGQGEVALALVGAEVAERQQPRQPAIGGAVARIGQDVGRAVREDEPGPDGEAEAVLAGMRSLTKL